MSDVRTALEAARDAFKDYAINHMVKEPPQVEKARVNRDLFNQMELALAGLNREPADVLDAAMADVLQFHRTFQIYLPVRPTPQDAFLRDRRAAFIRSECDELDVAITLADQADAYMDVIYFAVGGLVELGLEGSPLWRIVHGANMAKLWPDGQPRHREGDRKIMKPPGWEDPRPQLEAEVDRQLKRFGP